MDSLNYSFDNPLLLEEALTHPSCNLKNEHGQPFSYQRLEFLGDAVLGAVISELLIVNYPNESEGELARRKAALVNKTPVAEVVRQLGIHKQIRFSDTEGNAGGADNSSVQEDVGEAIIGAIFVDGGYGAAKAFITTHWMGKLQAPATAPVDPKTALQEWTQARSLGLPKYELIEQTGPAHAPIFTVEVHVEGCQTQSAEASTKRKAEQAAAAKMLEVVS